MDNAATDQRNAALRTLPAVSTLLADPAISAAGAALRPDYLTALITSAIADCRAAIVAGAPANEPRQVVLDRLHQLQTPKLRPVLNATGVIVHTNLGRAPVSAATAAAMATSAQTYTPLELDLSTGNRGGRLAEVQRLLSVLTGAPAALVVNNNAAATLLTLAALAAGRAVVLARGEAVEIGGGFRVPDVMRQSGATLVEVGTTNRTYAHDYQAAVDTTTAALLKVHTSNFRITGFTHETSLADLVAVGRQQQLPVIHDIGSGALRDPAEFGLDHEPLVTESVRTGATVTLFSGDKLLGGPQAGIIIGDRQAVAAISQHPLARAVRADKATLAGLAATLRHYLYGEELSAIPIWQMIAATPATLQARAAHWQATLAQQGMVTSIVPTQATVGGGSLPGEFLPSFALALDRTTLATASLSPDRCAALLRQGEPAAIGRILNDQLLLDARTILPADDVALIAAISNVLRQQ